MESNRVIIRAFAFCTLLLITISACTPDSYKREVRFSVSASSSSITKTEYGETGSNYQYIDWVSGDRIYVRCPQCIPATEAYYDVSTSSHSGTKTSSTCSSLAPLFWGEGTHTFYAVYPPDGTCLTTSGGHLHFNGSVSSIQSPSGPVVGGVVKPDMSLQFMLASVQAQEKANSVQLNLYPYTTAIEFSVTSGFESDVPMVVKSIVLESEDHFLSGGFSVDLDDSDGVSNRCKCTSTTSSSDNKLVELSLSPDFVQVAKGGTINFTVFLNPGCGDDNIDDITFRIRYNYLGGTGEDIVRQARMDGKTFPTHKKTNVIGIMLPEFLQWEINGVLSVSSWDNEDSEIALRSI